MKPELLQHIWDDTRAFLGRHYVIAFLTIFVLAFLAFGWEVIAACFAIGAACTFIMYQMPDDDHNGPKGA